MGISLIGSKEMLYASIVDLSFDYKYETTISKLSKDGTNLIDRTTFLNFSMQNMQIDNFISKDMPVLLCPKNAYQ